MEETTLKHWGIKGQKWGVRRSDEQLRQAKGIPKTTPPTQKKISTLSDDDLRKKIGRLELEKRYSELTKTTEKPKFQRGKKFVLDVLETSGKTVAIQLSTYAMGSAVNKIAKTDIVNVKKMQKDK